MQNVNVPLLITNDDNIIYPTSHIFVYNRLKSGECGRPLFVHEQDRDVMFEVERIQTSEVQNYSNQVHF